LSFSWEIPVRVVIGFALAPRILFCVSDVDFSEDMDKDGIHQEWHACQSHEPCSGGNRGRATIADLFGVWPVIRMGTECHSYDSQFQY
jgi:hypothetical protein